MTAADMDAAYRAVTSSMFPPSGSELSLLAQDLGDRWASTPAFLGRTAAERLASATLEIVHMTRTLPERLYGGDLRRFAIDVGLPRDQLDGLNGRARAALKGGATVSELGRADVVMTSDGPQLLEVNLTSALGAPTIGLLNRALLANPHFRAFAEQGGLDYVDPVMAIARTVAATCRHSNPRVAIVDTADNLALIAPRLEALAAAMARAGGPSAVVRSPRELEIRHGSVFDEQAAIDVVLRYFLIEDLLTADGQEELAPLLGAAQAGEVALCTHIESDVFGSKGALALVSEHAASAAFDARERAVVERFLPWTRVVRPWIADEDGTLRDTLTFARDYRTELTLKPMLLHGGHGVVLGWECEASEWERRIRFAVGRGYVLQRRVRPKLERAGQHGSEMRVLRNWGIFFGAPAVVGHGGFAGAMVRSVEVGATEMISWDTGATVGCVFLTPDD